MPSYEFLYEMDMFGKTPEFYFQGRPKKVTTIGVIFTFIYIALYIAYFIYKLVKMIQRVEVTYYDTYAFTGETPSIQLTSDNFYGGFGLLDPNGSPFVNEQIYYATAIHWQGIKTDGVWEWVPTNLPLEKCKLEKFGSKYQDIFKSKDLENMYCLENVDVSLAGYATSDIYSYFVVNLYPCVGQTSDGLPCLNEYVVALLTKNNFQFQMQDIELTPQDHKNPVQVREKDISGPVYSDLYQKIYAYLQITQIETDEDIIGFGLDDVKNEKYLKYDESWIISAPMGKNIFAEAGEPLCEITIQLSEKVLTQKRSYTTLFEVLGDVGGLMEVVSMVLKTICSFIVDILYEISIINNLFQFDLDKKLIILKEPKKKNNTFANENTKIYSPRKSAQKPYPNSIYLNNPDNSIQTRNKLSDENINKNKFGNDDLLKAKSIKVVKKKKKKVKKDMKNLKLEAINNENNNVNNNENNNANSNVNNEKNSKKGETEMEYMYKNDIIKNKLENNNPISFEDKENGSESQNGSGKKRIINNIQFNCISTYLWFLCVRKRKNINNILLDEGNNILVEQLDIINLFRKLLKDEQNFEITSRNENIDMSETCKLNLQEISKNILYNP